MLLTLNGLRCIDARVCLPLVGAWHATVHVDAASMAQGPVTLEAPGLKLQGVTYRVGSYRGAVRVYAIGGAGRLSALIPARAYRGATVRILLGDILREAGETMSGAIDPKLLGRTIATWSRMMGTAGRALATLLEFLLVSWRVLEDGSVWIGTVPWGPSSLEGKVTITRQNEATARATVAAESAELRPGTTLEGRRIVFVDYAFSDSGVRAEVEYG